MKLIILTQYFPPEVGAPQNRLYEIAIRLQKLGVQIEVLTAMPNYPQMEIHSAYKGKWYVKEEMDGMPVHRAWIWVNKSKSILSRLLNYFSFVFTSICIGLFKLHKADFLFCESPPLFLGISALILKRAKKAKLIFNVADLWPQSAEDLGLITNRFLLNTSTRLEESLYSSSSMITGQTQGIISNISTRFPSKPIYWLPNGVDLSYYNPDIINGNWRKENKFQASDYLILYAGIIGHGQGLEVVLNAAEITASFPSIKWILLGNGPEKEKMLATKEKMKIENVYFFEVIPKIRMPEIWKTVDCALIPLRRLQLFKGSLPSKAFEAMAMQKPILLGVEGEAEDLFIKQGMAGVAYIPEDATDLANKALYLFNNREIASDFGRKGRTFVRENFDRDTIALNLFHYLTFQLTQ